jgi:hypothetical protein
MVGLAPCSNLMSHRRGNFALRVNMRYRSTIATAADAAHVVTIGLAQTLKSLTPR